MTLYDEYMNPMPASSRVMEFGPSGVVDDKWQGNEALSGLDGRNGGGLRGIGKYLPVGNGRDGGRQSRIQINQNGHQPGRAVSRGRVMTKEEYRKAAVDSVADTLNGMCRTGAKVYYREAQKPFAGRGYVKFFFDDEHGISGRGSIGNYPYVADTPRTIRVY